MVEKRLSHSGRSFKVAEGDLLPSLAQLDQIARRGHRQTCSCSLAAFRLSTLLEWLPWLAAFASAVLADGWIVRVIKSKEFRQHDPELFALYACLAIVVACATVVGFVVPVTLHPLVMPVVPIAISVLLSRAVASFHRRG